MSFETHFFPFWERTKNVSRDTNDFNIDSLMGKKKCLLCFEIHVFHSRELSSTRRWAIDSDGVARLVEMSSVIKVVLLAMCFLVLAFCLVGCYSRWDLSLSDNDSVLFGTCSQVQLSIYVSCVFPQSGFRLHSGFAKDFPPDRSGCLPHLIVECSVQTIQEHQRLCQRRVVDTVFRHSNNFLTGTENVPRDRLFFVMIVYSIILTFKRHNFTNQLVSWI